jgi:hypothetical protein
VGSLNASSDPTAKLLGDKVTAWAVVERGLNNGSLTSDIWGLSRHAAIPHEVLSKARGSGVAMHSFGGKSLRRQLEALKPRGREPRDLRSTCGSLIRQLVMGARPRREASRSVDPLINKPMPSLRSCWAARQAGRGPRRHVDSTVANQKLPVQSLPNVQPFPTHVLVLSARICTCIAFWVFEVLSALCSVRPLEMIW